MPDDEDDGNVHDFEEERDKLRKKRDDQRQRRQEDLRQKRSPLRLAEWLKRELPERDHLLGSVLSSTSRWLIFGDTGIGKTLFTMMLAGAVAAGTEFLDWGARSPRRVMYLDGEMPAETHKERLQLIASIYGEDLELYSYCRDDLPINDMPPLNTDQGREWLWWEVHAIQPEVLIGDSLMCLTTGLLSDEESWLPMKILVEQLSSWRVAQIWLHHTGHDAQHAFGTKSREWLMDTVLGLFKVDDQDPADTVMRLEFQKSRLKTPANASEFKPRIIRFVNGVWTTGDVEKPQPKQSNDEILRDAVLAAYDHLADGIAPSHGLNGQPVTKVATIAVRDEVCDRGFLDCNDDGKISSTGRSAFARAKAKLLAKPKPKLVERKRLLWRI